MFVLNSPGKSPSFKMTESSDFKYRMLTIKDGFIYPPGYEPYVLGKGKVKGWLKKDDWDGNITNVFFKPIFFDNSINPNIENSRVENKNEDKIVGLVWPEKDSAYKHFSPGYKAGHSFA